MGRVFQAKIVERGAWMVSSLCQPRGALVTGRACGPYPVGLRGGGAQAPPVPSRRGPKHSGPGSPHRGVCSCLLLARRRGPGPIQQMLACSPRPSPERP